MPVMTSELKQIAADYLSKQDPRLAPLIARFGPPTISPHTNYYEELVDSIIGQQLSVKAAATILGRFKQLFGGVMPTPEAILTHDVPTLRSVGLSNQKANYIQDLAQHVLDGRLVFDNIESLPNEAIISMLTDVKGVGEWTAHMFLMFCMGRSDILAHGDLGIRNGVRKLYNIPQATPADVKTVAERYHWHPYESIACWYVWKSLDNVPDAEATLL